MNCLFLCHISWILFFGRKCTDKILKDVSRQRGKICINSQPCQSFLCGVTWLGLDYLTRNLREQNLIIVHWTYFFSPKSTSNYHARRFGVRAAMPGFIAKKLCPHLTIVPLNFEKYGKVSKEVSLENENTLTKYECTLF